MPSPLHLENGRNDFFDESSNYYLPELFPNSQNNFCLLESSNQNRDYQDFLSGQEGAEDISRNEKNQEYEHSRV